MRRIISILLFIILINTYTREREFLHINQNIAIADYLKKRKTKDIIEVMRTYKNLDKLFYRKLSYREKTYPYYIEITIPENKLNISFEDKEKEYRKLAEDKLKEIKKETMKYYITNVRWIAEDKAITKEGNLYNYDFLNYGTPYDNPYFFQMKTPIDIEKFDEVYKKMLDSTNIMQMNKSYIESKEKLDDFFYATIESQYGKKEVAYIYEDRYAEDVKDIMYCKNSNFEKCEVIDIKKDKRIKIKDYSDYKEVTVDNNQGFYILKDYSINIFKTDKERYSRYWEYETYSEMGNVSYLRWILPVLIE